MKQPNFAFIIVLFMGMISCSNTVTKYRNYGSGLAPKNATPQQCYSKGYVELNDEQE